MNRMLLPLVVLVGLTMGAVEAAETSSKAAPAVATTTTATTEAAGAGAPGKSGHKTIPDLPPLPAVKKKDAYQDVASEAMPLSAEEIKRLRQMAEESEWAAEAIPVPRPVSSSLLVSLAPGMTPPVIRISPFHVTSVLFLSQSGDPLKIISVDKSQGDTFTTTQPAGTANVIHISTTRQYAVGNVQVNLQGVQTPVALTLVGGQREVDYRVDLRIRGVVTNQGLRSGAMLPAENDAVMMSLLDGVSPDDALELKTSSPDVRVWKINKRVYVRTPHNLLSPAYLNPFVRSADGTTVYDIPPASTLVVLANGVPATVRVNDVKGP